MPTLQTSLELLATFSCAIFAGAAVYINLVEHPARMSCGVGVALTQWAPSYKRATWMQAPLALSGFVAALGAWLGGSGTGWLVGGGLLGLVVPVTLAVIMPTNRRLLSPTLDKDSDEARHLLDEWNRLHGVRTVLSVAALMLFLLNS